MKRLRRSLKLFFSGIGTLWGCKANLFIKILAFPVMVFISLMCCALDLIDGEEP